MNGFSRGGLSALTRRLPLVLLLLLSGCLTPTMYVDTALPVVRAEDLKPPSPVGPVQVIFEFRTQGTPNSAATDEIKPIVLGAIGRAGLFSQLSDTPVPDGRTLTIVINNVKLTEHGSAAAFGTGLTFGLVGTMVTDGYVCTATYRSPVGTSSSKTVKHALHSTIGNASGPPGVPAMQPREAITQVMEQLTLNALQALRQDGL
jgi:hypothetical protein